MTEDVPDTYFGSCIWCCSSVKTVEAKDCTESLSMMPVKEYPFESSVSISFKEFGLRDAKPEGVSATRVGF